MKLVLILILICIILVFAAFSFFVRFAPVSPEQWHADPLVVDISGVDNAALVTPGTVPPAPEFAISPHELAVVFDQLVMAAKRTHRVAGSVDEQWITYQQRSAIMGYPDYISVRFLPVGEDKSTLAIYSRARFGRSDFGVNAKRIDAWLDALTTLEE